MTRVVRMLVASPFGAGGEYNGPAVLMDRLFDSIDQAFGARIDLVYASRTGSAQPRWARNSRKLAVRRAGIAHRWEQLVWSVRLSALLIVQHRRYDHLHLHGAYIENLLVAIVARALKLDYSLLPVLEGGDLGDSNPLRRTRMGRAIVRRAVSGAYVCFALSDGIRFEFESAGASPDVITNISNPVTPSFFRATARQPPLAPILGFVGKIGERKRPDLILDALGLLRSEGIYASARFVGPYESDEYREYFETLVSERHIDGSVVVTGYLPDVSFDVREMLDFFVLPSSAEGLPGALTEAIAAGLPTIVTEVGAMGDVVRASASGRVVDPSARAIANAVAEMLEPHRYSAYSASAVRYANQELTSESVAAHYWHEIAKPRLGAQC